MSRHSNKSKKRASQIKQKQIIAAMSKDKNPEEMIELQKFFDDVEKMRIAVELWNI